MKNELILLFLVFGSITSAQIIHFPDANFKNALVNSKCVDLTGDDKGDADADLNNDGEIDVSEAIKCFRLLLKSKEIKNLEGIDYFKNLTHLNCYSNELTTLDVSNLTNLQSLHCHSNQLTILNVSGLINLKILHCDRNQLSHLDIKGLINLYRLYCHSNKLTKLDLTGLTSLSNLYCGSNELTSLDLRGLTNLEYLSIVENQITSVDLQDLRKLIRFYCAYNSLTSLDVNNLINLKTLNCRSNKIKSLFIKTGSIFDELIYSENPDLNYICCNEFDIENIFNITIGFGIINCEVNSYCTFTPGGKYYKIQGNTKFDKNNNGCDGQDIKWSNLKYQINRNNNLTGLYIASSTGNFAIALPQGTHTITPLLDNHENFEATPSSFTITFPSTSDTITQDFCVTPKGIFRQTNISVIPLTPPARPGFEAKYKIVWENVGNQIESSTLNFTYDETLLDYISATQSPDQIADGIVKWNFTNLLPFEKREITVTLKVNSPTDTPAVNAGDKLYLTVSILDNIFTLENTVVGSYDPNDKTCLQGDRVKPDMVGEYVDYLIRFENTGNYAAENVVVKDIIDTKRFDVSTLKITDASHEVYTRIEGNKVEFIFENIKLPFDDANNDGYIAFKIKTLPTLVIGDSLKNLADIYFDYNFPIRTNEAKTTIALSVPTVDITIDISIYPNPVRDNLHISTKETWTKAEIYDISGRILRVLTLDSQSIDVSSLESGSYFVRLKNGEKEGRVKFIKM